MIQFWWLIGMVVLVLSGVLFAPTVIAVYFWGFIVIWWNAAGHRSLAANGTAVRGTIISKRTDSKGGGFLTFEFSPVESRSDTLRKEISVRPAQYTTSRERDEVTVLYDERNPKRCFIYKFCMYRAV